MLSFFATAVTKNTIQTRCFTHWKPKVVIALGVLFSMTTSRNCLTIVMSHLRIFISHVSLTQSHAILTPATSTK